MQQRPGKSRDDFSERVKRTVAERAAYICANPTCRRPTVEPHSDPDKSLKTGEACHIRAAAPGGPRYDPAQTQDERGSMDNAIWLCTECSTRIDKDASSHPVQTLLEWRRDHEAWITRGGMVPSLPEVSLTTIKGRTLPDVPSQITVNDCQDAREHSLRIKNIAHAELLMVDARVQLPEPVIRSATFYKPVGIDARWEPVRPRMVVTGSGTVTRNRPPLPTNLYQLQMDRLPPSHYVEIAFITSTKSHEKHDLSFDHGPFAGTDDPPYLRNFIDGSFQFEYHGAMLKKRFFAPIQYNKEKRQFSILEVREDPGEWRPVEVTLFS